jgi:hypothetical protein
MRSIKIEIIILQICLRARFFSRKKKQIEQVSSNPKILPAQYPRFRSQEYQRQGLLKFKEILMCQVCQEIPMRYYPLGGRLLHLRNRWRWCVIGGLSLVKFGIRQPFGDLQKVNGYLEKRK